ncbi:MAG: hypothetical protein IH598_03420 [Bacteroidales bacterium]|nr:hypothetical protein [Bacteroidales bacterium]
MFKLVNGIQYDTVKAEKILEANGQSGKRALLKFKNGRFFILQEDPPKQFKILPCNQGEAIEFVEIHSNTISQTKYQEILKKHFGIKPEPGNAIPYGSVVVFKDFFANALYASNGNFYLHSALDFPKKITKTEALQWIEDNQDVIPESNLKKIIANFFPTTPKA